MTRAGLAVAAVAVALVPSAGARTHALGCCYDAQLIGGWDRRTNTATVSWLPPYADLVTDAVRVGTTIDDSGFLADDAGHLEHPAGTQVVSVGTSALPIDSFVYAQVWFHCAPRDPAHPACGPIDSPAGAALASRPVQIGDPREPSSVAPTFVLAASADRIAVRVGSTATAALWVIPKYGFYESATFAAVAPAGLAVSFARTSSPDGTTLTVAAAAVARAGVSTIELTAAGGGIVRTRSLAVDVAAGPPATTTVAPKPKPKPRPPAKKKPKKKKRAHSGGLFASSFFGIN
jgi:hypothetical protein